MAAIHQLVRVHGPCTGSSVLAYKLVMTVFVNSTLEKFFVRKKGL